MSVEEKMPDFRFSGNVTKFTVIAMVLCFAFANLTRIMHEGGTLYN